MQNENKTDIASLSIELNELKSIFDRGMRDGDNFSNLKMIYSKIKELTCHLQVLDWNTHKFYST